MTIHLAVVAEQRLVQDDRQQRHTHVWLQRTAAGQEQAVSALERRRTDRVSMIEKQPRLPSSINEKNGEQVGKWVGGKDSRNSDELIRKWLKCLVCLFVCLFACSPFD